MINDEKYIMAFVALIEAREKELELSKLCCETSMPNEIIPVTLDEMSDYSGNKNRAQRRQEAFNKRANHGWKKLQRKNKWKD